MNIKKFLRSTVALALFGFVSMVYAGVNPITNMPDYNGTYYGTPNTGGDCDSDAANCDSLSGRKMFTTLYRDNYDRTGVTPCAGERCGSHAGVDISVTSGTPVKAALAGTVVVSDCKEGPGTGDFGGTVVIEANNPYVTGNKIYLVYAHMDKWDNYSVGSLVSEGATIGLSGGKLKSQGGVCPGGSRGAHLHFQVDKFPPDSSGRPWFPKSLFSDGAEHADTGFDVPKYTHNPIPFVLGYAYNFTFAENNNKELWGAANVTNYNTVNSDLWIDSSSAYPYVGRSIFFGDASGCGETAPCSREFTLDAGIFKRLAITLDFKCFTNPVVVWFRGPDDVWHGGSFNYDSARQYVVNMGGLTYWNGIISDLIVQPSQGCTASPGPAEYFIKQMFLLP